MRILHNFNMLKKIVIQTLSCTSIKTVGLNNANFLYSLKRLSLISARRNEPDVIARILQLLSKFDSNNKIFIYEVGFDLQ